MVRVGAAVVGGLLLGVISWGSMTIVELSQVQAVLEKTAVTDRDLAERDFVNAKEMTLAIQQLAEQFGREQKLALEPLKIVMEQNRRELEKIRSELADARKNDEDEDDD